MIRLGDVAMVVSIVQTALAGAVRTPCPPRPSAVLACGLPLVMHRPSAPAVSDSAALVALNAKWLDAYARHDSAAVARVLDDDFLGIIVQQDGRTARLTKRDIVAGVADPSVTDATVTYLITQIVITGDVAMVVGRNSFRGQRSGQPFVTHATYADVYARRRGVWRAVSMHLVRTAAP